MNLSSKSYIIEILSSDEPEILQHLMKKANYCRDAVIGNKVYLRGLIEFSNYCSCNCLYCGLRKSNDSIKRYHLTKDEIITTAMTAHQHGHQSICLQSGEIRNKAEIEFLVEVIKEIKELSSTNGEQSLGITLSIGELSYQQYKKLWDAGAHRYLLRIETSDPELFKLIHPPAQVLEKRIECLAALRDIGFQVGTGVMIGLPSQTPEHLARDLEFFVKNDIDMLGMGPYIPHPATPLADLQPGPINNAFITSLKMIALSRLFMPDINIVASTALQTIHPDGLKWGLNAGANIVMPVLTPAQNRPDYELYLDKNDKSTIELNHEIQNHGYQIGYWQWGDSPHYYRRLGLPYPCD